MILECGLIDSHAFELPLYNSCLFMSLHLWVWGHMWESVLSKIKSILIIIMYINLHENDIYNIM